MNIDFASFIFQVLAFKEVFDQFTYLNFRMAVNVKFNLLTSMFFFTQSLGAFWYMSLSGFCPKMCQAPSDVSASPDLQI